MDKMDCALQMEYKMSTQSSISEQPREKNRGANLWTTGMALFSMFFGAGNLIFSLIVGVSAVTQTSKAVLGLGLSAVLFPLLGLVAMLLYRGDLRAFLARLGVVPAAILLFILYVSQGPLACLPRLVTLMHASVHSFFPSISLAMFSVLICGVIFLLAARPSRMVQLLGVVLTPILLLTMAILVIAGIVKGSPLLPSEAGGAFHFMEGLKGGYQTMDLTAALLFATVVIPHLLQGSESLSDKERSSLLRRKMIGASSVAAALLMLTYIGLCFLASRHAAMLQDLAPEQMLYAVATRVLGSGGAWIAAGTVFLACLTTAISLSAIFSEYLHKEFLRNKGGSIFPLVITLGVTAVMSNLGFSGLMKLIGPAMQILYPSLIVLCLTNIGYSLYSLKPLKLPVYAALGVGIAGFCLV
jgi:LIVCS family branched-chain amino acid:cation transporter